MNDHEKPRNSPVLPQRLRTYLIVNVVIAILMGIVLAVRTELRTGRYLLIDVGLILLFSSALAALTFGQLALVEIYLYRKRKGMWYDWKNGPRRQHPDRVSDPHEVAHWKNEARRARLSRQDPPPADGRDRTRLFEAADPTEKVSRASLLLKIADKLERSGKREAAEECYRQIVQRFADSPEAAHAAQRLASMANA
jgi:hypothetical protein